MKTYVSMFRIRFLNGLQYRTAALAGIVTQYAWGFMEVLAFIVFYQVNSAGFPMTLSQTVTYIWLRQSFLSLFAIWLFESDIFSAITDGGIAYELARPVNLYAGWFCRSIANRVSKMTLRCFPILIVALILPAPLRMSPPVDATHFILFLISMLLGAGVVISLSLLIYVSTFYTLSSVGVRIVMSVAADFLSGGILPLPFFPDSVQNIVKLLPFAAMQDIPLRIYSGNIANQKALLGILLQGFWLFTLCFVGFHFMQKALQKVVIQRG